ncbi:MAG: hypothetical protein AVDCRST_MAG93-94 [uncultured Chloroflexia bacterium]|uniref:Uncharacterized protein n=1 Tax=uncultured Chloroflexia bacterium TaxID=1672391 RepID=A0A6J4H202_9CHLR|nr:MAG: hypothetical protein AVDCRST_MAG93-94 [uncultured Chloroflexia bacterium]
MESTAALGERVLSELLQVHAHGMISTFEALYLKYMLRCWRHGVVEHPGGWSWV